jgi:hypothetical protein
MNQDFVDLLRAFDAREVRYLVVGAYALAVHGRPRATGDLDVWVEPAVDNAHRVMAALIDYGAPVSTVSEADFSTPGIIFQIGIAPRRIDILTALTGTAFADAWSSRVTSRFGPLTVPFIGREAFIANKRATGRAKDLADLEGLERSSDD